MSVAGLLLAAGGGRRLGRPKALVRFDGELLVERGARSLRAGGCAPVVVVLGAAADEVIAGARLDDAVVVVNDAWAEGMGSSLRAGLAAPVLRDATAVVVSLVDQPYVSAEVVRRLVEARAVEAALVASYDGKPRNPARLDASIWPEVAEAAVGDVGARGWMRTHPQRVRSIACDDLGSAADIDTPDDLSRLVEASYEPRA